ncbi:RNA-guided pseudouridylation complex pseudouridine synthase subunit Cbf5 [archaeon]|jgi:H/ACA ribonucleoprotein complex subunit 4|nr:RNA-guided pseudouridylation complex pseudouridine synthase subunit Cbf5 [archaeon]MBT3577461.1 RNA-guided pseudouridylation complex pseudouridine synthase subunit Cbf5 [archaeon]MBT6820296.1 RNA-guided pseudouridylation complex pseudouridine synthase subunit Cbf5 [archaeon]MBT6955993.1 RNA-guided pseudouridylation complex pseudouridine synthase subunit Cbf5 [archaeon]MBT7025110.1 RNA-guided pseudouridylation complex pseudouridine synthase subunit Cbf5 [archaeon]
MVQDIQKLLNFGLINIDKPAGPTSYSVSEFVKRKLGLKKTSHMGTLDPKVTGVLPITLGRACRLADHFIRHDKSYIGILQTHKPQKMEELQELIDRNFTGKIKQVPPVRSAVKRAERVREVYKFEFLEANADGREFLFYCKVEGGTYIRKICSDLGEMIGGAHMGELRRTMAGIFDEKTLVRLEDFEKAVWDWKERENEKPLRKMIVPAEDSIKKVMPVVYVDKQVLKALYNGKPLFRKDTIASDEVIKKLANEACFAAFVKDKKGEIFVGVYKKTKEKAILGRAEFVYN